MDEKWHEEHPEQKKEAALPWWQTALLILLTLAMAALGNQ